MTLDTIQETPNGLRAILFEQYENITAILPVMSDNLIMRCEQNGMGHVKKIAFFQSPQEMTMDLGGIQVTQIRPSKGQSLKLDRMKLDGELPSSVLEDISIKKFPIFLYMFQLNDIDGDIMCSIDVSNQKDYKASIVIEITTNSYPCHANAELHTVIGFIQHLITLSVSTYLTESFISAYMLAETDRQKRIAKRKISLRKIEN